MLLYVVFSLEILIISLVICSSSSATFIFCVMFLVHVFLKNLFKKKNNHILFWIHPLFSNFIFNCMATTVNIGH